jgi:hypothetical protein
VPSLFSVTYKGQLATITPGKRESTHTKARQRVPLRTHAKLLRRCSKSFRRRSILGFDIHFYCGSIETKPAPAKSVVTRFPIEKTGTYLVTVLKPDGLGMKMLTSPTFPKIE